MLADHFQNQQNNPQPQIPPPDQGPGGIPILPAPLPQNPPPTLQSQPPILLQPQSPVALTAADVIGEANFNFAGQPPAVPMVGPPPGNPDQAAAAFAAAGQPLPPPPQNFQQGPPPPPVVTVAPGPPPGIPQNFVVGGRSVSGTRSVSGNQSGPPPQPEIPPPPGAIRVPPALPGPVDPFQDPLGQTSLLSQQQQQPSQPPQTQRAENGTPAIVGLGPLMQPTPAGPPQAIPAAPPSQLQSPPPVPIAAVGGAGVPAAGGQVQQPELSQYFPYGPGQQMVTETIDTLFNRDSRQ